MSVTVAEIYKLIDTIAPFSTQLPFDNAGILVGSGTAAVKKIAVCLDITKDVATRAVENECDLIVSHHPVIFNPIRALTSESVPYILVKNGISAICAHTNLDAAKGGVNDHLAVSLGLGEVERLYDEQYSDFPPIARLGTIEPTDGEHFAQFVKEQLDSPDVRYTDNGKTIRRVCVFGGAGNDFLLQAKAYGADAVVTSEIKHHQWLQAKELDLTVIDAGHFSTENVVIKPFALLLKDKLDCEVRIISQSAPYKAL